MPTASLQGQLPAAGPIEQNKPRCQASDKRKISYVQRWHPALLALLRAYPPGSDTYAPKKDDVPIHQLGYRPSH
jgi:hypothetical protein